MAEGIAVIAGLAGMSDGLAIDSQLIHAAQEDDLAKIRKEFARTSKSDRETILCVASLFGHLDILQYLVEQGVKNGPGSFGGGPLPVAAKGGHLSVVEYLIDVGLTNDRFYGRALRQAVKEGYPEIVSTLLRYGADPTEANRYGKSARNLAEGLAKRPKPRSSGRIVPAQTYEKILDILNNPPIIKVAELKASEPDSAGVEIAQPRATVEEMDICKDYMAHVLWFTELRDRQERPIRVDDLVYGEKLHELETTGSHHKQGQILTQSDVIILMPDDEVSGVRFSDVGSSSEPISASENDDWRWRSQALRWIHLPANNKKWVLDLLTTISRMGDLDVSEKKRRLDAVKQFLEDNFDEYVAPNRGEDTSFRHPNFHVSTSRIERKSTTVLDSTTDGKTDRGMATSSPGKETNKDSSPTKTLKMRNKAQENWAFLLANMWKLDASPRPNHLAFTSKQTRDPGYKARARWAFLLRTLKLRTWQSRLVTLPGRQLPSKLVMVLPYIDMESNYAFRKCQNKKSRLREVYKDTGLHIAQTLDRSYYLGLENTASRDTDQIVLKQTTKELDDWNERMKNLAGYPLVQSPSQAQSVNFNRFTDKMQNPVQVQRTKRSDKAVVIEATAERRKSAQERRTKQSEDSVYENLDQDAHVTSFKGGAEQTMAQTTGEATVADGVLSKMKQNTNEEPLPALLMVNRLWLWKIDERTIITAFPDRDHEGDDSTNRTLLKSLVKASRDPHIRTLDHLIAKFASKGISYLHGEYKAGLKEPVFRIFARNISDRSNEVAQYHDAFRETLKAPKPSEESESTDNELHKILKEVTCLREIEDARDEIYMMKSVLDGQAEVVDWIREFAKHEHKAAREAREAREVRESTDPTARVKDQSVTPDDPWSDLLADGTLQTFIKRFNQLDEDAKRVEKSLTTLLDLKQKQANINEAVAASKQARDTATQGEVLMIFTIITVIFTPLSFMASLFALPIVDQFPQSKGGTDVNGNQYSTNYMLRWIWTGELATIVVIIIPLLIRKRKSIANRYNKWAAPSQKSSSSAKATSAYPTGTITSNASVVPKRSIAAKSAAVDPVPPAEDKSSDSDDSSGKGPTRKDSALKMSGALPTLTAKDTTKSTVVEEKGMGKFTRFGASLFHRKVRTTKDEEKALAPHKA